MDFIPHFFLFITAVYIIVALFFLFGLFHLKKQPKTNKTPFISIVIAARNEAEYIGECLASLKKQTYPSDRFEILVIDDDSKDHTSQIVASAQMSNLQYLAVGDLFPEMAAKKKPMSVGIHHARGEWILTTDADCTVPPTWIASIASYMTPETGIVIGFSQLKTATETLTFFERLQAFDFLALMAAAAGAAGAGFPLAASGQNFAYRKDLFDKVGGFKKISHRPSGDDVLLLQLLQKSWHGRTAFASDSEAFVNTWRPETPSSFWQQRKRWASNAAYQVRLNFTFFLYIIIVFFINALLLSSFLFSTIYGNYTLALICWCAKTLSDLLLIWKGAYTFKRTELLKILPLWELLQIPYTILIGLAGTVSGFTWKNRHHQ